AVEWNLVGMCLGPHDGLASRAHIIMDRSDGKVRRQASMIHIIAKATVRLSAWPDDRVSGRSAVTEPGLRIDVVELGGRDQSAWLSTRSDTCRSDGKRQTSSSRSRQNATRKAG